MTGKQFAFQYGAWGSPTSATFLENDGSAGIVLWQGRNYSTSGGVLILNASGDIIFDSHAPPVPTVARTWTTLGNTSFAWESWSEAPAGLAPARKARSASAAPSTIGAVFVSVAPFEQLNMTQDDTELVVYGESWACDIDLSVLRHLSYCFGLQRRQCLPKSSPVNWLPPLRPAGLFCRSQRHVPRCLEGMGVCVDLRRCIPCPLVIGRTGLRRRGARRVVLRCRGERGVTA